jgi:hypothetical protein
MTKLKRRNKIKYCECGCGQIVSNRFVSGHNLRTKETKSLQLAATIGKPSWNKGLTKETDNRVLATSNKLAGRTLPIEVRMKMKERKHTEKQNENHSLYMKEKWSDSEYKNKVMQTKKENKSYEKSKEKVSNAIKELWKDLSYRDKMMQARAKKCSYQKTGDKLRNHWKDPKFASKYSGKNHYNWQGGISKEPYAQVWSEELKEIIRKRDGYMCQVCFLSESTMQNNFRKKLCVHHIDYDKKNCNEENLITLCTSCHTKTGYSREQWQSVFAIQ